MEPSSSLLCAQTTAWASLLGRAGAEPAGGGWSVSFAQRQLGSGRDSAPRGGSSSTPKVTQAPKPAQRCRHPKAPLAGGIGRPRGSSAHTDTGGGSEARAWGGRGSPYRLGAPGPAGGAAADFGAFPRFIACGEGLSCPLCPCSCTPGIWSSVLGWGISQDAAPRTGAPATRQGPGCSGQHFPWA